MKIAFWPLGRSREYAIHRLSLDQLTRKLASAPSSQLRALSTFGTGTVGVAQRQLVLARLVAPVRHRFAVGRPGRRSLGDARRFREIADRAVLRRHREHVAVRLEDGALGGRRERGARDLRADVLDVR